MSLAEALRRSNPDRALTNGGGDFVDEEFLPPEGAPTAEGAENSVEGGSRLSPAAFTPTP